MKLRIVIAVLLISLCAGRAVAHQDMLTWKVFDNVTVRITTGFDYEEINKVFIIGDLVNRLAKEHKYSQSIFLDFRHHYVSKVQPDYFVSFDDGSVRYSWSRTDRLESPTRNKGLVIRQVASVFDIETTLRLAEYGMLNKSFIRVNQMQLEYEKNHCQWIIQTIDTALTRTVATSNNSMSVSRVSRERAYRNQKESWQGISYYAEKGEFTFVIRKPRSEDVTLIVLPNVYLIKEFNDYSIMVFDTDSSFYYMRMYGDNRLSSKHTIRGIHENYRPFKVEPMGGGLFSIHFSYSSPTQAFGPDEHRNLVYDSRNDKLVQNLREVLEDY